MLEARDYDAVIYLYKDNDPLPRSQRLTQCAYRYARRRGLPAGDFTLATAEGGKPYFPHSPHIHFSISHSGELWAAAFGGQPLGLDIQRHEQRDHLALAQRWYHGDEYAAVKQNGPACFFDIWCAKESLVKCSGEGFAAFCAFCTVQNGRIAAQCGPWQLRPLELATGYSACLCGKKLGLIHIEREEKVMWRADVSAPIMKK